MRGRVRAVLEWCGFTPSQRERSLARSLGEAQDLAYEQAAAVLRVQRLLHFRESLGARSIDMDSIRDALSGEDQHR